MAEDMKPMVVSNMVPLSSKITKHKLNGSNYYDWSQMIWFYLRNIEKDDYID